MPKKAEKSKEGQKEVNAVDVESQPILGTSASSDTDTEEEDNGKTSTEDEQ